MASTHSSNYRSSRIAQQQPFYPTYIWAQRAPLLLYPPLNPLAYYFRRVTIALTPPLPPHAHTHAYSQSVSQSVCSTIHFRPTIPSHLWPPYTHTHTSSTSTHTHIYFYSPPSPYTYEYCTHKAFMCVYYLLYGSAFHKIIQGTYHISKKAGVHLLVTVNIECFRKVIHYSRKC